MDVVEQNPIEQTLKNEVLHPLPENAPQIWEYADLVVDYLAQLGVEYVFGVPGGCIEPLYNALARGVLRGGPRAIVSRHETGAAFMANGYARESGRLGVCCGTSGPGSTNLLTGVSCAYADEIPLLVITAQTPLPTMGKDTLQESAGVGVNTITMFESCTHYNTFVSHPDQLETKLLAAIVHATSNTSGPVHLSIPVDILRMPLPTSLRARRLSPLTNHEVWPNPASVQLLQKEIDDAKSGVLVIGPGCEGAMLEVLTFATKKNWPIVTTPMGKGLISAFHPLYLGVFGLAGHDTAFAALEPFVADIVIAVGTVLDECATAGWDLRLMSERLIFIDSNPRHISQASVARLCVLGSPRRVFQAILKGEVAPLRPPEALRGALVYPTLFNAEDRKKCLDTITIPIKPQALFWALSQACSIGTRVACDSGNSFLWGIYYWHCPPSVEDPKNNFHVSLGFASMGWAIGASIGLAMASPEKPVVCVTGDGSILMSGQEMTVALTERLNILFVILNDSALGTVKHGQRLAGAEPIAYKLPNINFASMANAMGLMAYRIHSLSELMELDIAKLFQQPGPCVLDVVIDGEETPPLGVRMRALGTNRSGQQKSPHAMTSKARPEVIYSRIWEEEAEKNNPFAASTCYCHGYDVYGDLLGKISWVEYLYLLLKGELPNRAEAQLLETLAVAIANPGPREPSVMAAMCGGVGGSTWASCLSAALAVGAGQFGGAHEVAYVYAWWKLYGFSFEKWQGAIANPPQLGYADIWPSMEHIPGFDPNGVTTPTPVLQTLEQLARKSPGQALVWFLKHRIVLEQKVGYPLAMTGVAAAAFYDLGFDKDQAELGYLLLRLPGAAAHAREQRDIGVKRFPFFWEALELVE